MSSSIIFNKPITLTNVDGSLLNNADIQLAKLRTDCVLPPSTEVWDVDVRVDGSVITGATGIITNQYFLEYQRTFSIPTTIDISAARAHSDAIVYGYDISGTQSIIDICGGVAKSYPTSFTKYDVQVQSPDEAELVKTTYANMRAVAEPNIAYFLNRGYALPPPDSTPEWAGSFYNYSAGMGMLMMNPIVEGSSNIVAIQLIASNSNYSNSLDSSRNLPFLHRPVRIPCTKSFSTYLQNKATIPYAFFDDQYRTITISYPSVATRHTVYDTSKNVPSINYYLNEQKYLTSFESSFAMVRRNKYNQIQTVNSIADANAFIQVSPSLIYRVTTVSKTSAAAAATTTLATVNIPRQSADGLFLGVILPKYNGGNKDFDITIIRPGVLNGLASARSPQIVQACSQCNTTFGDNPNSKQIEFTSVASNFLVLDTPDWSITGKYINPVRFTNPPIPERMALDLSDNELSPTGPPNDVLLAALFGHELFHNIQFASGSIRAGDPEGQATAIEMDSRQSYGTFFGFRPYAWYTYMMPFFRGEYTYGCQGSNDPLYAARNTVTYPDYGHAMWYTYLRTQFDKNHQLLRRVNDINGTQLYSPILRENGFEYAQTNFRNPQVGKLAMKQALQELYGLDMTEVYTNYVISLLLLRNNSGIPAKYRSLHPYWYWSQSCPFNKAMDTLSTAAPSYNDSFWWDDFDQHNPVKWDPSSNKYYVFRSGSTVATTIQRNKYLNNRTFIPSWPKIDASGNENDVADFVGPKATSVTRQLEDLSVIAFVLDASMSSITINDISGNLNVAVFKYSPDASGVGEFNMADASGNLSASNPYIQLSQGQSVTIPLAQLHAKSGITKLAVINRDITDLGGLANCYQSALRYSGRLRLDAVFA